MRLYLKNSQRKKGLGSEAQVVKYLTSKHWALSSNFSDIKKERKVTLTFEQTTWFI
jgi:hypothetical protein